MIRTPLNNELQELDDQLVRLGSLVEQALTQVLEALETSDRDKAVKVIVAENTIDNLHLTIEKHTFRVLALQQPLLGRTLRYLTSIPPMAIDLERIGDEAERIAQIFLRLIPYPSAGAGTTAGDQEAQTQKKNCLADARNGVDQFPEHSIERRILGLGQEVRSLLQRTIKAFVDRDAQAARSLWQEDHVVDTNHYLVSRDLMAMFEGVQALPALQHDPYILQYATYMLWITHRLERIADHCTNICERLVFLIEGETDIYATLER